MGMDDPLAASFAAAITTGPAMKNTLFHAMAFFRPHCCINAPPKKVPNTAPSFAIPTMISSVSSFRPRSRVFHLTRSFVSFRSFARPTRGASL